jgi:hypothetical protein
MLRRNKIDGVKINDSLLIQSSLLVPAPAVMQSEPIIWVGCHIHRFLSDTRDGGWGWWCERARMSRSNGRRRVVRDLDLPAQALRRKGPGCRH